MTKGRRDERRRSMMPVPSADDIFLLRVFEEPLVPIGTTVTDGESVAVADAMTAYAHRSTPDDFSAITDYLAAYPESVWNASIWNGLAFDYYNTGHYSHALAAWKRSWDLASAATDVRGKALADRAVGELAFMYARLGMMTDLEDLLISLRGRRFTGPSTERITGAGEGLATMRATPEVAFKCGPYALYSIQRSVDPLTAHFDVIHATRSTPQGTSLLYLHKLSEQIGMKMRMAHRSGGSEFIVPSVVHLKLGHYAAITRREGNRYLLQDPTFGRDVWASRKALEGESSGYFLIPAADFRTGWRLVHDSEGQAVWGKGYTCCTDPGPIGPCDPTTDSSSGCCGGDSGDGAGGDSGGGSGDSAGGDSGGGRPFIGLARARVHLMAVSLNIVDEPVGYKPPVGPSVRFRVRYGQRDDFQSTNRAYSNFGPKWTFDWLAYIQDDPTQPTADVYYYMMGGGYRTYTGFNSATQTFAHELYDQNLLTRNSTGYEMTSRDGTKAIFSTSDGATGTTRRVFLTKLMDSVGNAVTLTYDSSLRIIAITDTIGQVTTLEYQNSADVFKITRITDPFRRAATFGYDTSLRLVSITDVAGLTSRFTYDSGDFIRALTTPYGTTTFEASTIGDPGQSSDPGGTGRMRSLEITYPDGSKERVEYNQEQGVNHLPASDPQVPAGMSTLNNYLFYRNTFHWDRLAYAYGAGDYNKATIYHWLHSDNTTTSGILESVKRPLENRVWYDYEGQVSPITAGSTSKPTHIGRALDDGTTQLHTYSYNDFGNVTSYTDPIGRTTTYLYRANGIDVGVIQQKNGSGNDRLAGITYYAPGLPAIFENAASHQAFYNYNPRGQVTFYNNPPELTTYVYDDNGQLTSVNGPLPGQTNTYTYDSVGRIRTYTNESHCTLIFDYDALDRATRITFPDSTFIDLGYTALDCTSIRDRAGRVTLFEYDGFRHVTKKTDPLGRVTGFRWCICDKLRSVTDPLGRSTNWNYDLQGRLDSKEYPDGSIVAYVYEDATSRVRQRIDEQLQVTSYAYNVDDNLAQVAYTNPASPAPPNTLPAITTPPLLYRYDPYYNRITSIADDVRTIAEFVYGSPNNLGAGQLVAIYTAGKGLVFDYDELDRRIKSTTVAVTATIAYDAGGRLVTETNPLGTFTTTYDGVSRRPLSRIGPNGLVVEYAYAGPEKDHALLSITNSVGGTVTSKFEYDYDTPTGQIVSWTQTLSSTPDDNPNVFELTYDAAGQLVDVLPFEAGEHSGHFWNEYDVAGNRTKHDVNGDEADPEFVFTELSYNALNQLTTIGIHPDGGGAFATDSYVFNAEQRLARLGDAQSYTSIEYDYLGRRVAIQEFTNGLLTGLRQFVWWDDDTCEELDATGAVVKRYFAQGVQIVSGPNAGNYYYTRDHLASIREVLDSEGNVRASYLYAPFGASNLVRPSSNTIQSDFGFTGMFQIRNRSVYFANYRVYDPVLGRWLSRDPLEYAELSQGPNLHTYVGNDPINRVDPSGLSVIKTTPLTPCQIAFNTAFDFCIKYGGPLGVCIAFADLVESACNAKPPEPPSCFPILIIPDSFFPRCGPGGCVA